MLRYLIRRGGQAVLVLWAAYTLSFVLLSGLPGDAIRNRINAPDSLLTPQAAQTLLSYYGVDRPIWSQYLHSLHGLLTGDLGFSLTNGQPVGTLIAIALPSTLALTAAGLVFAVLFAGAIGLAVNYARWPWLRGLTSSLPALFTSVPIFVIGILVIEYLSFGLHLIPPVDDGTFVALLAPAATLGLVISGPLSQVFAGSVRTSRRQPFAHVLRARGAGERYTFRKSVLRNSSLPVLTLLGLTLGELIAGSVVTETVYARKGIGQLVVDSVNTQDLPVVQGVVLLTTVVYVVVNFGVDLVYPFIDPRILLDGAPARAGRARRTASVAAEQPAVAASAGGVLEQARVARPAEVAMP